MATNNNNFRYEITEKLGVISTSPTGWSKELNRISWNGTEPKLDIREFDPSHEKMSKGLTFTDEEAKQLRDLLDCYFGGDF